MKEKLSLPEQRIIDCLKINYGIKIATLTYLPLALGTDMQASIYKTQTPDQTSYFIKLKQSHHQDTSAIITESLHNAGVQQIIPLIKTI